MELLPDFIRSLEPLGEYAPPLVDALEHSSPEVAVRLNMAKAAPAPSSMRVPWEPVGFYLEERPAFTLDPALHQGRYYVQDASSMIVGYAVRSLLPADTPLLALDACAAPGGKSTALIDALPPSSALVSNEIVPKRAAILRENIIKWGSPRTIVTRGNTARLAASGVTFDLILADVPCSGEGMMRKDATAASQWSPGLVRECASLQSGITDNLWRMLRPGGVLLYSTCTFNAHEDEEQVMRLVEEYGAEPLEIPVEYSWGTVPAIGCDIPCLHFFPGRVRGEGLFICALRKLGELRPALSEIRSSRPGKEKPRKGKPAPKLPLETLRSWILSPDDYAFSLEEDRINAIPSVLEGIYARLREATDVIHHGIPLGTVKGKDIIPAHALAMSTEVTEAFPRVELSRDEAVSYLRREPLTLPADTPRGYIMPCFGDVPLGFAKHLGTRTNNLYPAEYRILH